MIGRLVLSVLLVCGLTPSLHAAEDSALLPRPFQSGERLTYDISWLNISAGTAVMEVLDGAPRGSLTLLATTRSNPMVTKFYPVDNRVESQIDGETLLPQRMSFRRREGKKKNDFEYTFRHKDGTVLAVKDGNAETLAIPPDAQDAISCLYYVRRSLALKPGSAMTLNVHHDKKTYTLDVRVEEIERIKGPWGVRDAARLLVVMPFQGIFLNQGNVRVWLSTDDRRIPLRMKAKVIIGSITADLVDGLSGLSK